MDSDSDVPVTITDSDEGPLTSADLFRRFTAWAAPVEAEADDWCWCRPHKFIQCCQPCPQVDNVG